MVMRHSSRRRHPEMRKTPAKWLVDYGGLTIECRDEADAKRLARSLLRKGYRVAARAAPGAFPPRRIDANHVRKWLSE
jgi:hypothetical protein